jgi:hypothetical protein
MPTGNEYIPSVDSGILEGGRSAAPPLRPLSPGTVKFQLSGFRPMDVAVEKAASALLIAASPGAVKPGS